MAKLRLPNDTVGDHQRATREAVKGINESIFFDGRLIEDVDLTTTAVDVEHGLGRTVRGFIIVNKDANADVWRTDSSNESKFIKLDASGTVTVSLWVF